MIDKKFIKVAKSRHFFSKHQRVLVAVSGGIDSINLLHLLYQYQDELAIELGIAHINHGQRLASLDEENYLKKLADELELPIYIDYFKGKFSEKNAREFRYQFFKKIMEDEHYTAVVTAHHADDQVETVLMRLIRGSGLFQLSAIKERQKFGGGELIRPLLTFKKSEFQDYTHFEDVSNLDYHYFRNRVRHYHLPQLRQENPQLDRHLLSLSQEVTMLESVLAELTANFPINDVKAFLTYSPALQSYLFKRYLDQFPKLAPSKAQVDELLEIINKKANYYQPIKSGYYFKKDYDTFEITKISPETDSTLIDKVLKLNQSTNFGPYEVNFQVGDKDGDDVIYVSGASPVTLRHRRLGDKLLINGQTKKLRRYFIDNKIPQLAREKALVIEQDKKILAVYPFVTSDLSKDLKNDTMKSILSIKTKEGTSC